MPSHDAGHYPATRPSGIAATELASLEPTASAWWLSQHWINPIRSMPHYFRTF
jgi:hypothetical protein